ncbi:hypothetical protein [Roseibium litorale]|uniref:Uncharacterized protein n=1 Tax=Roseibium litorale TaxID=2803841 RepID=A0ABR9CTT0_9HYPH|nr:hypothetical protein [Roseibium litorale]MBD8894029.1 hypothetical protein [Roseibium litorale]
MQHVSANFDAFLKGISDVERNQVPFAIALTLTETVKDVERNSLKSMMRRLDQPTPFTQQGLAIKAASKRNLEASVFYKDRQASYLEKQETGGTRYPNKRAIPVPVNQRLNRFGNMPRGTLKKLLSRPDVFQDEINGVAGIWQRPKKVKRGKSKALKLLVAWEPKANYHERLRFQDGARKTTAARIATNFERSMSRALRSARR